MCLSGVHVCVHICVCVSRENRPLNVKSKQSFVDTLDERLASTSKDKQNVEADWAALGELVSNTATEILDLSAREYKDCFDENSENIEQLLDEKHHLHHSYLNNPKSTSKKDTYKTYADQYSRYKYRG